MSKSQKDILKGMTAKQKAEHIWEYYKLHIIGGVTVLAIVLSFIYSSFINPPNKSYSSVSFYGGYINEQPLADVQADLTDRFVPDEMKEHYEIIVTNYAFSPGDTANAFVGAKFAAELQSQGLDLLIADEEDFAMMAGEGYLMPLRDYVPEDILDSLEESQLFTGGIYVYESNEPEPTSIVNEDFYGIRLDDTGYLPEMGIHPNGKIIGLILNTPRKEASLPIIQYLLGFGMG